MALLIDILMLCIVISIPKSHGLTIKMIRKDTIPSFFPTNLTLQQKHQKYADLTRARVLHLRSQSTLSEITTDINLDVIRPPILTTYNSVHAVSLGIGSVPYYTLWEFDTGSHFSWVQSIYCQNCFPILGGAFNHSTSNTFRAMPLNDPRCDPTYQVYGTCGYSISYIGCSTQGFIGTDTLSFRSHTEEPSRVSGIVFGNALTTPGISYDGGSNNLISGLFGMATGRNSFLTQTRNITHMRFSYCLPPWNAAPATETFLTFGNDIPPPTVQQQLLMQTTPMRTSRYFLDLMDLSVGGLALGVDRALFALRPDGTGGFFIDSGSTQSSFVTDAYEIVKAAFGVYFWSKGVQPVAAPANSPYDLCYAWPIHVDRLPTFAFHFANNANLNVVPGNLFQVFDSNLACLTFLPIDEEGPNLLGSMHQANYRFVHDLNARQLTFYPEQCNQR